MSTTTMKYASLDLGTIEAVFNKLGGIEGAQKFLQGKLQVSEPTRNWREQDGVIYFSVISDGTTGEDWIERLKSKGCVGDYAQSVLRSPDFKPTKDVVYHVAILKGGSLGNDDRKTFIIRKAGEERGFTTPNAEVACLIRKKFSDGDIKAMGLVLIVIMHKPIKDSNGGPNLLYALRSDDGRGLDADCDRPDRGWSRECGFAFVLTQEVSTQN
jgi:hypothetical protein